MTSNRHQIGPGTPRRALVVAAVLAVVIVAVMTLVTVWVTRGPEPHRELDYVGGQGGRHGGVSIQIAAPHVPDGQRLVGVGDLAVAMPDDWQTGSTNCGMPANHAVYLESQLQRMRQFFSSVAAFCVAEQAPPSYLVMASAGMDASLDQDAARYATTAETVNGLAVLTGSHALRTYLLVPDHDLALVYTASGAEDDDALVADIFNSLSTLPQGWTSVPALDAHDPDWAERLNEAGLVDAAFGPARDADLDNDLPESDLQACAPLRSSVEGRCIFSPVTGMVPTNPPAGTVLAQGTEVEAYVPVMTRTP